MLRAFRQHLGLILVLSTLAAGFSTATAAANESIFPYPIHERTLENGLKTIVVPMPSPGLAAYWSIVRTGSRDEYEPGRTGFAHFFEHMMFRGTEKIPADEYNEIVTGLGADTNAYTTDDLTAYHLGFASEDLERVIEIESDRFMNLAFPKASFETEAGAVYGEYRKNKTNPFFSAYEAVQQTAFEVHTYGHTTMGYERDIKNMPSMYDYSLEFFERYYRPENVILLIAGDVDPQETFDLVEGYYGAWEPGYVPPEVIAEPEQLEPRSVAVEYEGQTLPILWLAYKAPRFDPRDKTLVAADLLAELAFGSTSDVYKKLVLEEQSVEFIQAGMEFNRDPGLFEIITRVKDESRVEAVKRAIYETIAEYLEHPPDEERLAGLKSRLRYGFLMSLETPDQVASSLARIVAVTGGLKAIDRYYATVAEVGPEDVKAAAAMIFDENRRTLATLRGAE